MAFLIYLSCTACIKTPPVDVQCLDDSVEVTEFLRIVAAVTGLGKVSTSTFSSSSAGETVARWFPASQSPAAAVSRDFRRRQGAPKRAPHPFSQARLTHPHQPPSTPPGPLFYLDNHPHQMVFLGSASWSQPLSNHTYCQLSVKDP